MSDFSDSDSENDELEEVFNSAAQLVQSNHTKFKPAELLHLYALYKQATTGPCNTAQPKGILQMQNRAKWKAWHELGKMDKAKAKHLYIEKVKQLDPEWGTTVENQKHVSKSSIGWVVHSTQLPPDDCDEKADHEKNNFDHVKEGNLSKLIENIRIEEFEELDEHGMGLIHWAADRNYTDILKYLLSSGADVDFRDAEQQTALHYAASCGHIECIQVLLRANADKSARDVDGQTCSDVAENSEIQAMLSA